MIGPVGRAAPGEPRQTDMQYSVDVVCRQWAILLPVLDAPVAHAAWWRFVDEHAYHPVEVACGRRATGCWPGPFGDDLTTRRCAVTYVDPESRARAEAQGYPFASEDVIAAGYDLAGRVCRELLRAGLPAQVERPGVPSRPGVQVDVDCQGEYAGGLYVRWSAPEMGEAGLRAAAEQQNPEAPEWKRHAAVVLLMQTALIGILRLAGFSVVRAEEVDDMADGDVYVHPDRPSPA
ncbi:hypothetical protein ACIBAH_22530 [Streptomyces sp. NPDC051445]|uniref:hypothetical protein n=1 Tax=Streptomyces sp. NPDC051445 TaxID=3365653 RepID=UPI0037AE3A57